MHDLLSTGVTCFSCYHEANRPFTPGMSPRGDPYVPARLMLRPTVIKETDCVDRSHSGLRGTAPRCEVVQVTCAKPPLPPSIRVNDNAFKNNCQVFFVTDAKCFSEKKQGHQPCPS